MGSIAPGVPYSVLAGGLHGTTDLASTIQYIGGGYYQRTSAQSWLLTPMVWSMMDRAGGADAAMTPEQWLQSYPYTMGMTNMSADP